MGIRERIRLALQDEAQQRRAADVRVGLSYTAVMLDNGSTGAAYTFHRDMPEGCRLFSGKLPLHGRRASELLELILSEEKVEASVGTAAANALANVPGSRLEKGDILDFISISPSDRVGMVGMFGPLIAPLRKKAGELLIFEKDTGKKDGLMPDSDIPKKLPSCQVALITATSIVNRTIDEILECTSSCREVVLLGATTPLVPAAFRDTPVTCLSGVIASEPEEVLRIVSTAGGMNRFKKVVEKVNLRLGPRP